MIAAAPGLSSLTSAPKKGTDWRKEPAASRGSGSESRERITYTRPVIGCAWAAAGNATANATLARVGGGWTQPASAAHDPSAAHAGRERLDMVCSRGAFTRRDASCAA